MASSQSSLRSFHRCFSMCFCARGLELMQMTMWVVFAVLAIGSISGCDRAVFVPEMSPMRVGPSSRMQVYMLVEGKWIKSSNQIAVPEGWYLVPPSYVSEDDK
jgi:hypothetical protein